MADLGMVPVKRKVKPSKPPNAVTNILKNPRPDEWIQLLKLNELYLGQFESVGWHKDGTVWLKGHNGVMCQITGVKAEMYGGVWWVIRTGESEIILE